MRVTVKGKLPCDTFGKRLEGRSVLCRQMCQDILTLCLLIKVHIVSTVSCQQVVQFLDQPADGWNELDQSLRNQHYTEVVTLCGTMGNDCGDILDNVIQCQVFRLDFLGNQADVRLCLQGALQCDVRSGASHQFDEMPVFACRIAVTLNIANQF